jgi:hypothetical protein
MTWRILGLLAGTGAVVAAVVAVLAPSHGTVIDPVAQAADTTASAVTAEFGIAGSVSVAGQTIQLHGNGALDMRNQRMRMSVAFPVPGLGSMQMDEIFDGDAFYVHFPESIASRIPGGKSWMKLDLDTLGKASGVDLKKALQANEGNPADMLKALKGVGSSHKVGTEAIGGAPTTHYRADVDLSKAVERIGDGKVKQMFKTAGVSTIPVDVWIDPAGRVRREAVKFSGAGASMDMTISFTRFGVRVDTTPPAADQVLDAGALLGS